MKKFFALLVIVAAGYSCSDDPGPEGDLTGPKIVGFGSNFESVSYFADEGTVEKSFAVNLIGLGNGKPASQDIVVNYEIDTENTTAVEGQEYNIVDTSGSITIPAGSTFGMFPLEVITGGFNPTQKTQLVLKLSSADGAVVGQQYSTLRIVFVGCLSELATEAGTGYSLTVKNNVSGVTVTRPDEVIKKIGVNTFRTQKYSGTYVPSQLAPATETGFTFIDICGEMTVPSQYLGNYWGNIVKGLTTDGTDGHVIDSDTFEITYEISFAAGNQNYTGTYTRNN